MRQVIRDLGLDTISGISGNHSVADFTIFVVDTVTKVLIIIGDLVVVVAFVVSVIRANAADCVKLMDGTNDFVYFH